MTRLTLRWPTMPRATRRRALAGTITGLTVAGLLTGAVATGGAASAAVTVVPIASSPAATGMRTVTLITGDVVHVTDAGGGKLSAQIERPRGASGGVRAQTIGKDLYVIPDEALPYLAADKLDRRLFDVTLLLADGYGDKGATGIPLIVSYGKAAAKSAQPEVPAGTVRMRNLPSVNAVAVRAPKTRARDVWRSITTRTAKSGARAATTSLVPSFGDDVSKIWLDGRVHANLADSVAQIGAPAAWAAGHDGKDAKVAVLDTGVDLSHPDLVGQIAVTQSFVPGQTVDDGHGHGTHTASTIAGTGEASGGTEKGVAPGADLMIGKVLANEGYGEDSWVIAGMEWAAHNGADVISMSLGGDTPSDGTDPMSMAVNELTAETGALFVIAAGNSGAEAYLTAPGAADAALTVAATDQTDQLAYFSTRGPRYGDYGMKPDISAPGVGILAAKAGGNATDGWYQEMDGTSMATPHVAGAAAILVQQHPTWTPTQLKDALTSTSKQLPLTAYEVGGGRVDVAAADKATITATGSAYFGFQGWPHSDTTPIDRTITYTNTGAAAITLHLAQSAAIAGGPYDTDPTADQGVPAPDGMFDLSADTVTVPAHGTATVASSALPGMGQSARRYLGQIVATDGDGTVRARTQVGLYIEDERHNMHITVKDRSGAPAATYVAFQRLGVEGPPVWLAVGDTGELTVRTIAGTYSVYTYLNVAGSHGPDSTGVALMGDPEVVLDQDRDIVLDARQAHEATAVVSRRTQDRLLYLNWYRSDGGISSVADQYLLPAVADSMFALPTKPVTTGEFEYEARWRKQYPMLTLTADGRKIEPMGLNGARPYDGTDRLDAVYVGTGTPEEYADRNVKGKAVLVTRSDAVTGQDRALAAAAAGASLLLVVNDRPGKLFEYVGTEEGAYVGVAVSSITQREGAPLIAAANRGRLRLTVEGVPNSPYLYDLVDPRPGRVPTDLTYRPRERDLATVDVTFHGTTKYDGGEFRADYRPYRPYSFGFLQYISTPDTRTDYVSAQKGTSWSEEVVTGPNASLVSLSNIHAYKAGARAENEWFGPVVRPRDNDRFYPSIRYGTWARINVQPWSDGGAGHAGYIVRDGVDVYPDTLNMKVYENGTLVSNSEWASGSLDVVPEGTATYTLDLTASRDPNVWHTSTRTHTTWTVISKPATDQDNGNVMPVLQLDYGIDTDLSGDAWGGRQRLSLTASHLSGAVGTGKLMGASLSVSFDDGKTWHRVDLSESSSGGWTTTFNAPSRGFVSLRASAWDSVGNKITQEVVRAYGLTAGSSHTPRVE